MVKRTTKWAQNLDIQKGSFTSKAKKNGGMTNRGTIKQSFITKEMKSSNPRTKKEAVLANNFRNMSKKKGK